MRFDQLHENNDALEKMAYHERMSAQHIDLANEAHKNGDQELRDQHKAAAKEHRRAQLDYESGSPRAAKRSMDAAAMSRDLLEGAPEMKGDWLKAQRERDREHADAMGRHVKSGRKKTYTSTQRSLAKMRGEELPEGYKELPKMDTERYGERAGLEGPFQTMAGKVVYYDPREGAYYDPDTDMYMTYDEFKALDNDRTGMKEQTEKRWKQTSMSPEAAAKEFGKENVRVKKGALRNGDDMVEVYVAKNANLGEAAAKIACLKCDEVSTAKAWEKNRGFCPKCKTSSQGVAENINEGDMTSAADELEAYARENGGIDTDDFMTAVAMMRKGDHFKLNKFIDDLDTEPREKILSVVLKHLGEDVSESMSDKEVDAFHRELDKLVHKHLGHSSEEEMSEAKPGHNMMAMARAMDKINRQIEKSRKARGAQDDKEEVKEFTGAIASVAMPMGQKPKRKKANESNDDAKARQKAAMDRALKSIDMTFSPERRAVGDQITAMTRAAEMMTNPRFADRALSVVEKYGINNPQELAQEIQLMIDNERELVDHEYIVGADMNIRRLEKALQQIQSVSEGFFGSREKIISVFDKSGKPIDRIPASQAAKKYSVDVNDVLQQLTTQDFTRVGDHYFGISPIQEDEDPCWKNYRQLGTKMKDGREVPNCVPKPKKKK